MFARWGLRPMKIEETIGELRKVPGQEEAEAAVSREEAEATIQALA
jgi:biotin synthase